MVSRPLRKLTDLIHFDLGSVSTFRPKSGVPQQAQIHAGLGLWFCSLLSVVQSTKMTQTEQKTTHGALKSDAG